MIATNQNQLAKKIGIDRGFFNRIVHAKVPCPKKTALLLEKEVGIPAADWIFYPETIKKRLEDKFQQAKDSSKD